MKCVNLTNFYSCLRLWRAKTKKQWKKCLKITAHCIDSNSYHTHMVSECKISCEQYARKRWIERRITGQISWRHSWVLTQGVFLYKWYHVMDSMFCFAITPSGRLLQFYKHTVGKTIKLLLLELIPLCISLSHTQPHYIFHNPKHVQQNVRIRSGTFTHFSYYIKGN